MMRARDHKRLFWIWSDMRGRCSNSNHRQYRDYGGRGVTVCDRWQTFSNFAEDMGDRPDGLSLDRVDNSKGYGPENCQWATRQEQNSNRRNCILVDCDGERVTLKEACRRRGLSYRPVVKRIQDRGWPVDLAISTPVGAPSNFLASQVA
jgi:hypothetical protein